jgi:hypothetical protein
MSLIVPRAGEGTIRKPNLNRARLEHTGGYTLAEATRVAGTLPPDVLHYRLGPFGSVLEEWPDQQREGESNNEPQRKHCCDGNRNFHASRLRIGAAPRNDLNRSFFWVYSFPLF